MLQKFLLLLCCGCRHHRSWEQFLTLLNLLDTISKFHIITMILTEDSLITWFKES